MLRRRPGVHALVKRVPAGDDVELDLAAGEAEVGVRQERPRQQPRLAENLEAVADPEHEAAGAGQLDDGVHRRGEARDRPRPQVVPEREAAWDDHCVGSTEVAVAVPHELGLADHAGGAQRVDLVAGAGELQHREPHPDLTRR